MNNYIEKLGATKLNDKIFLSVSTIFPLSHAKTTLSNDEYENDFED